MGDRLHLDEDHICAWQLDIDGGTDRQISLPKVGTRAVFTSLCGSFRVKTGGVLNSCV